MQEVAETGNYDPIGWLTDEESFAEIEHSTGFAGADLLEDQWGVWTVSDSEYRDGINPGTGEQKTPSVHFRLVGSKEYNKSPGKSFFADIWLSKKKGGQQMIDGFTISCGLGAFGVRFGEATKIGDSRALARNVNQAGAELAKAINGRELIGFCKLSENRKNKQTGEKYDDRNELTGMHRINEDNLRALEASGYLGACISVKSETVNGKKRTWLAPKALKKGRSKVVAAAGAQPDID